MFFIKPLFLKSNKINGGAAVAIKHKKCGPWVKPQEPHF